MGASEVRHEDDASTGFGEMLDRWDRRLDAGVVGNVPFAVEGNV